jgi:hypothetical protein
MEAPKRTGGRPRKPPTRVKRATFSFRVTERMRDQLAAAAADEGRSISEEIEHRLARSFYQRELIGNALPLLQFAEDMADLMRVLEQRGGRPALGAGADPSAYLDLWAAFEAWFAANRPTGAPALLGGPDEERYRARGEMLRLLSKVSGALLRFTSAVDEASEVELQMVVDLIRGRARLLRALSPGSNEDG